MSYSGVRIFSHTILFLFLFKKKKTNLWRTIETQTILRGKEILQYALKS